MAQLDLRRKWNGIHKHNKEWGVDLSTARRSDLREVCQVTSGAVLIDAESVEQRFFDARDNFANSPSTLHI